MAINLKPVDVAVVGLGRGGRRRGAAAGARRIESGRHRSRNVDGSGQRFQAGRNSQQRARPGDHRPKGQARNSHFPHQPGCRRRAQGSSASDDERRRRHVDSLSRAELAVEAVGFQDALGSRSSATARATLPKGSTLEDWPRQLRRTGAVLRHRGARGRRLRQGGQHSGQARSGGQCL